MARPRAVLFDDQRSTGKAGVGPDRLRGREHRPAEQLVPDRQREAEVDVLGPVEQVMDAVEVRADEDPLQRAEAQAGVRVGEGDDRAVDDEQRRRQCAVGEEHERRGSARPGTRRGSADACGTPSSTLMSSCEWWSSWKRQSMPHAVVGEVHEPVAPVHRHEDGGDRRRQRGTAPDPRQHDPRHRRARDVRERQGQRGHERHDHASR